MAILISDNIDIKSKKVTRNKGHYVLKGLIQQEAVRIINIYIPNDRSTKYMKQELTE